MATKTTKRRTSSAKSDKPKFDIYEVVTGKIMAALEEGVVPWRRPWKLGVGANLQRNVVSKRPYRGVNQMLLGLSEFESPWWITFNAAKELGGRVIEGQARKSGGPGPELVVFWNRIRCSACTDKEGNVTKTTCERCNGRRAFMMLKWFNVWNVEQIEGLPETLVPPPADPDDEDVFTERDQASDDLIDRYVYPSIRGDDVKGPKLRLGGDRAAYAPARDRLAMPEPIAFSSPDAFYHTLFHELIHSTGHGKRLDRDHSGAFGTPAYAKEELIAEVGASMLAALTGVQPEPVTDNTVAYIGNWLTALQNDKKLVVSAAAAAQRAADFIVGTTFDNDTPKGSE